jgi:hypothetical protein
VFVRSSGEADIVAMGPNNSPIYYWATPGSSWTVTWVAGSPAENPLACAPYTPVNGTLFGPNGEPSYLDVSQGVAGDCWLMASLAEVAARDPACIKGMFSFDGYASENGSTVDIYTVRLFSRAGGAIYVTVDTELPGGGTVYARPVNGVLWPALVEKAWAAVQLTPDYRLLNGGDADAALECITGQSGGECNSPPYYLDWAAGDFLVVGTGGSNPASPYIVPDHDYAVINVAPPAGPPLKAGVMELTDVEIYNPWGATTSTVLNPPAGVYGAVYAPADYNAQPVFGQAWVSPEFYSQNFSQQFYATCAVSETSTPSRKGVASVLGTKVAVSANAVGAAVTIAQVGVNPTSAEPPQTSVINVEYPAADGWSYGALSAAGLGELVRPLDSALVRPINNGSSATDAVLADWDAADGTLDSFDMNEGLLHIAAHKPALVA